MERLVGVDFINESWREYADHSLTHDNINGVTESPWLIGAMIPTANKQDGSGAPSQASSRSKEVLARWLA